MTQHVDYHQQDSLKYHHLRTELGQLDSNIDHAIQGMKKPTTMRQSNPLKVYSALIYFHIPSR